MSEHKRCPQRHLPEADANALGSILQRVIALAGRGKHAPLLAWHEQVKRQVGPHVEIDLQHGQGLISHQYHADCPHPRISAAQRSAEEPAKRPSTTHYLAC